MKKTIVHCGLFGHVDSGKTAIARTLSQIVSTAGLDAHPQAKKRGISIDLGFTSFDLGAFTVALVDAPGHADLIRSVVASANIIDVAIIVIDASKGPEMQTGEHLVILELLGIRNVIVAMNKTDLLEPRAVEAKARNIAAFLEKTGPPFVGVPVVPVSAKNNAGFDQLRATIEMALIHVDSRRSRLVNAPFVMPFDHHFQGKGFGTIMTGTVLSGRALVGDQVEISPVGLQGKIKSIHIFKEAQDVAEAGDRAGIAVPGIDNSKLFRGCIVCTPGSIRVARHVLVKGKITRFFKHALRFKSQVHVTAGMLTVPAMLLPYVERDGIKFAVDEIQRDVDSGTFTAYLYVPDGVPCTAGFKILLSRLDLPPSELRICARADIMSIVSEIPPLYKMKEKTGRIKDPAKGVVEGLSSSLDGATRLVGREVSYILESQVGASRAISGPVLSPFGTKGSVLVSFKDGTPPAGVRVVMRYPKQLKITFEQEGA